MLNPYIAGVPVTADNFYGEARKNLINDILRPDNPYRNYVIFGLRRYGKTSLLEELARRLDPTHLYIIWTFSGCRDAATAFGTLRDSFLRPEPTGWHDIGFNLSALDGVATPLEALQRLANLANQYDRPLWVLCDECASLRDFHQTDSSMLARLGNYLRSSPMRVIMVGARPLSALLHSDASDEPMLTGYERRHLTPLSEPDIAQLVAASQHHGGPDLTPYTERIYQHTGGHPFLAQKLCLKLYEGATWEEAYAFASQDTDVRSGFQQDYQFVSQSERKVIHAVGKAGTSKDRIFTALDDHLQTEEGKERFISTLMQSGYLRLVGDQHQLANTCFSNWLADPKADLAHLESTVSDQIIQSLTDDEPASTPEEERRITILHLSDLHFDDPSGRGKSESDNVHRYKYNPIPRALEMDLAEDLKNELRILPDFIVISGDITYQSEKGGYIEAEKFLLQLRAELAKAFAEEHPAYFASLSDHEKNRWDPQRLGSPPPSLYACSRIIMVPGNHDIARKGTEAVIEEHYYRAFYSDIYGRPPHNSLMHWHYDEELDTAIVGFNSARLEPKHQLGFVDSQQFSTARDEINKLRRAADRSTDDDRTLRIAVVHHHLVRLSKPNMKNLKRAISAL